MIPKKTMQCQSTFAVKANEDLQLKTQTLRNIEKFIMDQKYPDAKKGANLGKQLEVLQDDIRHTQIQLNQLVSGGKEIQVLQPETSSQVEVLSMTPHMIKMDTKDHQGPLQISLEFIERFKGDIRVSVHTHAKVS